MRLAVFATHPVQYYAPLFRTLAKRIDLDVFYGHRDTAEDQARAGFGQGFAWDTDLLSGYRSRFLENVARRPGLDRFAGIDTPEVHSILRGGRFDCVLVMGWYRKMFLQVLTAAKLRGLPIMARGDSQLGTPRSSAKRAVKMATYPAFLRLFDAALVVGERNRAYWLNYGYPAGRIVSSPHCVDTEWFAARATDAARAALRAECGLSEEIAAVLFAGKLVDFKRPLDVVAAVAKLRAGGRQTALIVAGAGPLEAELRSCAARLEVPLHLLGFRNQSEMPQVYAAADVLVLPSTSAETWGLVVNEALACSCPVVVSDAIGCAPDLAAVGSAARSFPGGDVAACAIAIEAVLSNARVARARRGAGSGTLEAAADGIVCAARLVAGGQRS